MKKNKLTVMIAAAIILCAVSILPAIAETADSTVSSLSALLDAISAAPDDGTLYVIALTDDITLTNESSVSVAPTIPAGTNITLTSSGGVYTLTQVGNLRHIIVNGSLTLENIILDGSNKKGGILAEGGALTINNGTLITRCSSSSGSGVELRGATLTMNGGEIAYNQFNEQSGASGGGISLADGTAVMNGGSIHHNTSTWGGGVIVDTDGHFTMNAGQIYSNETTLMHGGGVHVYVHGTFVMNGGSIYDNKTRAANGAGGGVFVGQGSYVSYEPTDWCLFIMNGGIIEGNSADRGAGVAAFWNGNFEMNGGIIRGNTAGIAGGGVMGAPFSNSFGVSFIMNGGEISGNTTEQYGGGIAVWGSGNNNIDVQIGNGIDAGGGPLIRGNSAKLAGGGILVYQADVSMLDGSISGNRSDGYGGGVCIMSGTASGGGFTMSGGVIGGFFEADANTASISGGGIATYGGGNTLTITGGEIDGNAADQNGGGVYIEREDDTASFAGAVIARNTAGGEGGGIYTADFGNYDDLTSSDYQNITTDANTVFADNAANAAHTPPDIVYDYVNIGYSRTSLMKSGAEYLHPINNYDINFAGEAPVTPPSPSPSEPETPSPTPSEPEPPSPSPSPSPSSSPSPTPVEPEPPSPSPEVTEQPGEIPEDEIPDGEIPLESPPIEPPPMGPEAPDTAVPKTGDSSAVAAWLMLAVMPVLTAAIIYGRARRKNVNSR